METLKKVLCVIALSGVVGINLNAGSGDEVQKAQPETEDVGSDGAAKSKMILWMIATQIPAAILSQGLDHKESVESLARVLRISPQSARYIIQSVIIGSGIACNTYAGYVDPETSKNLRRQLSLVSLSGIIATRKWVRKILNYLPVYRTFFTCEEDSCEGICNHCLMPRMLEMVAFYNLLLWGEKNPVNWFNLLIRNTGKNPNRKKNQLLVN